MIYRNLNSMVDALGNDEPFEEIDINTIVFGNEAVETVEGSTLYVSPRNFLIGKKELNGMTLKGLDVEQMSFFKANFRNSKCLNAKFSKCNFSFADLREADFGYSTFYNCDFSNADLSEAVLTKCKFTNCKFESTNFFKAGLGCTDLRGQLFNKCNFVLSWCGGADFSDSKIVFSDLRDADFKAAILKNTRIEVSDLSYMNIETAYTVGLELFDCIIKGFDVLEAQGGIIPHANPKRSQWDYDLSPEDIEKIESEHLEKDYEILKKAEDIFIQNLYSNRGSILLNYQIFNEDKWKNDVEELEKKMAEANAELEIED